MPVLKRLAPLITQSLAVAHGAASPCQVASLPWSGSVSPKREPALAA